MSNFHDSDQGFNWAALDAVTPPSADPNLFDTDPELAREHGLKFDEVAGGWVQDPSHQQLTRLPEAEVVPHTVTSPTSPTTTVSFKFEVTDSSDVVRAATMGLFGQFLGLQAGQPHNQFPAEPDPSAAHDYTYTSTPSSGSSIIPEAMPDEHGYVDAVIVSDNSIQSPGSTTVHDVTSAHYDRDPIDSLPDYDPSRANTQVTPPAAPQNAPQIAPAKPERKPLRKRRVVGQVLAGVACGVLIVGPVSWEAGYYNTTGKLAGASEIMSAIGGHIFGK